MSKSSVAPLFESPDLTFIDTSATLQKTIPAATHAIHTHVSSIGITPQYSFLDELFGVSQKGLDVFFEPPPGFSMRANSCFKSAILPFENIESIGDGAETTLVEMKETLSTLEKMFQDIRIYMLRFCKG